MIAFGHTAVGTGVGLLTYKLIGQTTTPVVGSIVTLGAGIASHYLVDLIPHGHIFRLKNYLPEIAAVIIFDFFASVALFIWAAYHHFGLSVQLIYIFMGIIGAQIPDILDNFLFLKIIPNISIVRSEVNIHHKTHWHGTGKKMLMIGKRDLWQLLTIIIIFLLVITSKT